MTARRFLSTRALAATVCALAVAGSGLLLAPRVDAAGPSAFTCSGGNPFAPTLIPPGSYGPVTVAGFCYMQGTYQIHGGVTVEPGAGLDAAIQFSFLYGVPCEVFVSVSGGIEVQQGGILYLGNGPGTGCPNSDDVVSGGIRAFGAGSVVIHGTTIDGGLAIVGGGGAGSCDSTPPFFFGPFTDVEDSTIHGGETIANLDTCWIGTIRDHIDGGLRVVGNESADNDAIEVGLDTIHGSLECSGNFLNPSTTPSTDPNAANGVPTNFFDGFGPNPNTVTGAETGQCAGL